MVRVRVLCNENIVVVECGFLTTSPPGHNFRFVIEDFRLTEGGGVSNEGRRA